VTPCQNEISHVKRHPPTPGKRATAGVWPGKLGPDESEKIAQHLDNCDDCSETIVNLQDDTFVSLVRSSPAPAPMDEAELKGGESPAPLPEVTVDSESGATGSDERSPAELPPELRVHPRYKSC
jgi:hypothetical protein